MEEIGKIFIGQTALKFEVLTSQDLTSASVVSIKYKKPGGTIGSFIATVIDAKGGIIEYDVQDGDLDEAGEWILWAYVTFGTDSAAGEASRIEVYNEGDLI